MTWLRSNDPQHLTFLLSAYLSPSNHECAKPSCLYLSHRPTPTHSCAGISYPFHTHRSRLRPPPPRCRPSFSRAAVASKQRQKRPVSRHPPQRQLSRVPRRAARHRRPNGSGKSTLLEILSGNSSRPLPLLPSSAATDLRMGGMDPRARHRCRRGLLRGCCHSPSSSRPRLRRAPEAHDLLRRRLLLSVVLSAA